jgi:hypothetical protein
MNVDRQTGSSGVPRNVALEPPCAADVAENLDAMMLAGVPPSGLSRTFAKELADDHGDAGVV